MTTKDDSALGAQRRSFYWFEEWQNVPLECEKCGWHGPLVEDDLRMGDSSWYPCKEFHCPACNALIVEIEYSAPESVIRANREALGDEYEECIAHFTPRDTSHLLTSAEQLPDLEGGALRFEWNAVEGPDKKIEHIISCNGVELWRQPAESGDAWQYQQAVAALKAKYGDRIRDLPYNKLAEKQFRMFDPEAKWTVIEARTTLGWSRFPGNRKP